MKKPKIVRCGKCSNRVVDRGVGFQPYEQLLCAYFDRKVSSEDGCTFGVEGDSLYSTKRPTNIELGDDAAIRGGTSW